MRGLRLVLALAPLLGHGATGFYSWSPSSSNSVPTTSQQQQQQQSSPSPSSSTQRSALTSFAPPDDLTPEELRAQALAEYLERTRREREAAVAHVEAQKQAEIDALARELELQREAAAPVPANQQQQQQLHHPPTQHHLERMSQRQLVDRILYYQQYMQQYMVAAQQQKQRAVRQANDEAQKKWAEYMAALQLPPTVGGGSIEFASAAAGSEALSATAQFVQQPPPPIIESPLYAARRARIVAHSCDLGAVREQHAPRWHEMEVQRLRGEPRPLVPPAVAAPARPAAAAATNMSIDQATLQAADHGLRADGGIGGPTLKERINVGAALLAAGAAAATDSFSTPSSSDLYARRSTKVVQAGANSRWGDMEIQRSQGIAVSSPPPLAIVAPAQPAVATTTTSIDETTLKAADHGLRADGGIGGPSLKDRVNVGAQLLAAGAVDGTASTTESTLDLYAQRSAKILEAGKKSRWSDMEIHRLQGASATPPPATAAPAKAASATTVTSIDETTLQAADHGLRADGGIGGPTLQDRVNVGAQLLAAGAVDGTASTTESTLDLYAQRSAKILEAGKKSRWSDMEIHHLQGASATPPPALAAPAKAASATTVTSIDETTLQAADHGMRADGGIGGPSLKDRVNVGAALLAKDYGIPAAAAAAGTDLYAKRNAQVIQAGTNSRWGDLEIQRVQGGPVSVPPPATAAALAARTIPSTIVTLVNGERPGSVVPVEDRGGGGIVNVGARLASARAATAPKTPPAAGATAATDHLYALRNAKVMEAGNNSRWGDMELQKLKGLDKPSVPPATAAAPTPVASVDAKPRILPSTTATLDGGAAPPAKILAVEAADHGLRADGGVGGPTLKERVTGGAHLLGGGGAAAAASDDLYTQRNDKLTAAAQAGKSRWSEQEVARTQGGGVGRLSGSATPTTAQAKPDGKPRKVVPFTVVSFSETLSSTSGSDQDVTGAQRGVVGKLSGSSTHATAAQVKLDDKSKKIVPFTIVSLGETLSSSSGSKQEVTSPKEGGAGKFSGSSAPATAGLGKSDDTPKKMVPFSVVSLSDTLSTTSVASAKTGPVPPEVQAADHGLRADGGIGGLTLAERVATGARVAPSSASSASSKWTAKPSSQLEVRLYNQRNIKVLEAAKAGKSRWGAKEIERVEEIVSEAPLSPSLTTINGSTADSGTSSVPPSLQERINLGARLASGKQP